MILGKNPLFLLGALGLVCSAVVVQANAAVSANRTDTAIQLDTKPRYEFSLTALALRPSASNLNYVIYNKALPLQSPNWYEQELRPAYAFAFALGARYFVSPQNDVALDWTHLNTNTSSNVATPDSQYFLGPDYEIGPDAGNVRTANGKATFKYDVLNLSVGRTIQLDQHLAMRIFGGLSNGYLREKVAATYDGIVAGGSYPGPFSTQQEVTSNFTGLGPRVGVEANYEMENGFGFHGETAAAALIGSVYAKTDYLSASQQLLILYGQTSNSQSINDQTFVQVIPGFDAKLSMSYQHAFNQGVSLVVEGGYEAAVYVNAINQYLPGSLVDSASIDTGGIYVATMNHTQSNYSVQGPFLKATVRL